MNAALATAQTFFVFLMIISAIAAAALLWSYRKHRRQDPARHLANPAHHDAWLHFSTTDNGKWASAECLSCGTSWYWPRDDSLADHATMSQELREHQCSGS